ncbi:hypothetical protein C2G38_2056342 [Gigaspora rosea]|uniref:Uncharacterized protein n=1 Tax=Gigaspora rosea TaxID=44941 RepID=A0A397W6F8_9GLOM|nr:hypothetical protein C2G38_2056342 [Gigaspora rosea]
MSNFLALVSILNLHIVTLIFFYCLFLYIRYICKKLIIVCFLVTNEVQVQTKSLIL